MKRMLFLLAMLLSLKSFAQTPRLTFGDIPTGTVVNGEIKPAKTTSSRIIANGKFTITPGYEIMSYSVSILKGPDVWGPVNVKGAELTADIIDQIKKTKGQGVKVFFDEIKVKGKDGMPRKYNNITLTYDQ